MAQQTPPLQQVPNFRDVGQTVNRFLGQRRVREGLIFRSARPDDATPQDVALMRDQLGIKAIIDLRTNTELLKQAEKHQASSPAPAHGAQHSPRIAGITYIQVNITGRQFERHLLSQLCWWSFIKVLLFFLFGYRVDAVRIIGQEVLLQRGLVGLAADMLAHSGAEICDALCLYATAQSTPALIHCTQGKDRTGLVCALMLMILDVPLPAIEHDYLLTDAALASERHQRRAECREIGLTDDWASTAEDMVAGVEKFLAQTYGGLDAYLDAIGFDAAHRSKLRQLLLY